MALEPLEAFNADDNEAFELELPWSVALVPLAILVLLELVELPVVVVALEPLEAFNADDNEAFELELPWSVAFVLLATTAEVEFTGTATSEGFVMFPEVGLVVLVAAE